MYATVRRYEGVTDPSEAAKRVREGFAPILAAIPGFVEYYWIDAGGGLMISVSIFENLSGARESNSKASTWVMANLKSLLPKLPQITAGEVVVHKTK